MSHGFLLKTRTVDFFDVQEDRRREHKSRRSAGRIGERGLGMLFEGEPATGEEIDALLKSYWERTAKENKDRTLAIVGGAELDESLRCLLLSFMVDAAPSRELVNGPLGTFYSRIQCAYALGLISVDELADLHVIRRIRNHFAHGPQGCTFDDEEVVALCQTLRIPRKDSATEYYETPYGAFQSTVVVLQALVVRRQWEIADEHRACPGEIDPSWWADL
jgi:hypothetical protein